MKILHLAAALAAAATIGLSAASAAPASGSAVAPSAIVLAQYHHGDRHGGRPHYVPGRRYHTAPHGWHRYGRRPGDWRTRGCVLVGPLWFCP